MLGGIVVQLVLAEQHHAPRPVETVLVEVVRHALVLAGALVIPQRVRLPTLAEDVHLKLGSALQPTLKRLREMGLRQVEPRGRYDRVPAPTITAAAEAPHGRQGGAEIGL